MFTKCVDQQKNIIPFYSIFQLHFVKGMIFFLTPILKLQKDYDTNYILLIFFGVLEFRKQGYAHVE